LAWLKDLRDGATLNLKQQQMKFEGAKSIT